MKKVFVILSVILLYSCTRILNTEKTQVNIVTNAPSDIVYNADTFRNVSSIDIFPTRKKAPFNFSIKSDATYKLISVSHKLSRNYWLNFMTPFGFTGFLVDINTPKKYSYPKTIFVDTSDSSTKYYRYNKNPRTRELHFRLLMPFVNGYYFKPDNETSYKRKNGFWGLGLGLDYYYNPKMFLNFSVISAIDLLIPVPAPIDYSGEVEFARTVFTTINNNHLIRKFRLGYGISYSYNVWELRYYNSFDPLPPTRLPTKKHNLSFGFMFPIHYEIGNHFLLGMIYRPTFLRLSEVTPFQYEYFISLDLSWKFKVHTFKKK